jgi:hypothetical protein
MSFAFNTGVAEELSVAPVLNSYSKAPELNLTDFKGKPLSMDSYKGNIVVVSFLDKESKDEGIKWLEALPVNEIGNSKIVFVNIIYPGHLPFFVPERMALGKLQNKIIGIRNNLARTLSDSELQKIKASEIRWAVDWKRKWSSKWETKRNIVNTFIVDQDGMLMGTTTGVDQKALEDLRGIIHELSKPVPESLQN